MPPQKLAEKMSPGQNIPPNYLLRPALSEQYQTISDDL